MVHIQCHLALSTYLRKSSVLSLNYEQEMFPEALRARFGSIPKGESRWAVQCIIGRVETVPNQLYGISGITDAPNGAITFDCADTQTLTAIFLRPVERSSQGESRPIIARD